MKRPTAIVLILGVLGVCGLVAYATMAQCGGNAVPDVWLAAHRQTPALWALDILALYTLLLSLSLIGQGGRLQARNTQLTKLQDEHRMQLEAMLANTDTLEETGSRQADQISTQADQIATHEETIRTLSEQAATTQQENASLHAEIDARQEAFEIEARRLTEQAFRALSGQVDANARQLDAVNLALQYHRAEIQQLRHGLRAVQPGAKPVHVARLTPAEMSAITALETAAADPGTDVAPPDSSGPAATVAAPDPATAAPDPATAEADPATAEAEAEMPRPQTVQTATSAEPFHAADHHIAYSDNAPATVIMEPVYFRVVPAEPEASSVTEDGEPDYEQATAAVTAYPGSSDLVTPDEYSALLSPLHGTGEQESLTNGHASSQPATPATPWQRTL